MSDVIVGVTYDHKKSGNIRIGHMAGFGSCVWHHLQRVFDGWTHSRMRAHYGPSLMDGGKLFEAAYGSNDFLIDLQRQAMQSEGLQELLNRCAA